jgi:hypothetical protein
MKLLSIIFNGLMAIFFSTMTMTWAYSSYVNPDRKEEALAISLASFIAAKMMLVRRD